MKRLLHLWPDIASILLIVAATFMLYGAALPSGFQPKDDWEAILFTSTTPWHPQLDLPAPNYTSYLTDYRGYALEREFMLGRFRPVYWTLTTVEAHLFHSTPVLWHLETLLLGAAGACLLYVAARRMQLHPLPALVGALLLVLSAYNLWVELAISEEPALLFTTVALLLWVEGARRGRLTAYDWVALLVMILAGWLKESFTLIIPAMLLGRGALQWLWFNPVSFRTAFMSLLPLNFAAAVLIIFQLALQAWVYQTGYFSQLVVGGSEAILSWATPIKWLFYIGYNGQKFGFYLPLFVLLVAGISAWRTRFNGRLLGMIALTAGAWLLPQLLLYTHRGMFTNYLFPAGVMLALVSIFALELMLRIGKRMWVYTLVALMVLASYGQIRATLTLTAAANAHNAAFHRTISTTSQTIDCNADNVLLYTEKSFDMGASILTWLGEAGCPVSIDLYLTRQSYEIHASWGGVRWLEEIYGPYTPGTLADYDWILIPGPPETLQFDPLPAYDPRDWQIMTIQEHYSVYPRWSLVTIQRVATFTLLQRR